MPPKLITRPAGMCGVPLGVVDAVPGRDELDPAPVELHRAAEVGVEHARRPRSPSSLASSTIATTGAPVRLAMSTVSPMWSAWPWVSRIVVGSSSSALDRRLRVAGQERVDQDAACRRRQLEAGVAQEADVHDESPSSSGLGELTGQLDTPRRRRRACRAASPRPRACARRARARRVLDRPPATRHAAARARRRTSRPRASASLSTRWSWGAARATRSCAPAQPRRVAERLDRGVDLLVGVGGASGTDGIIGPWP